MFRLDRPFPTPLFSWPIEPFDTVDSLVVGRILHLDPRKRIRTRLRLADDAFEVLSTHQLEETRAAAATLVWQCHII